MRVTLLQTDIAWENKQENLLLLRKKLETLRGKTEIVVLPETFSTGFSMDSRQLAEPVNGHTLTTLRQWAAEFQFAIAGSYIACSEENNHPAHIKPCYNRAFFLTPEGDAHYCDKRHLFRMGKETDHPLPVCYDLRFPVWSRNVNNEYDLLIYVANWPVPRRRVWDVLLQARALENICYVCGVNRVGTDGNGIAYNGGSVAYSPKGELLTCVPDGEEGSATASLDLSALRNFRQKFPAWKDAESFLIKH